MDNVQKINQNIYKCQENSNSNLYVYTVEDESTVLGSTGDCFLYALSIYCLAEKLIENNFQKTGSHDFNIGGKCTYLWEPDEASCH
jgi:hypothetical protein